MDFLSVFFISYLIVSFLWIALNVTNNIMNNRRKKGPR